MEPLPQVPLEVAVYAHDPDSLVAFYSAVLGVQVVESGTGFATLAGGAIELSIVAIPAGLTDGSALSRPPTPLEDVALKPVFVVGSLDAAVQAALAHGGVPRPEDSI